MASIRGLRAPRRVALGFLLLAAVVPFRPLMADDPFPTISKVNEITTVHPVQLDIAGSN